MNRTGPHSHHHHHHHIGRGAELAGRDAARVLRVVVVACVALILVGVVMLWPSQQRTPDPFGLTADPVDARATAVEERECTYDPTATCVIVTFELQSGPHDGEIGELDQGSATFIGVGDGIQVTRTELASGDTLYSFHDFQRSTPMLALVVLFIAAVVALGRWRGVGALIGLAGSLAIIVYFALPALVEGNNAVVVALVTAGAVAVVALYLAHGFGSATDVALLSTLASLVLTGLLAWVFIQATKLTGYSDDASFVLDALGTGIDARGILLAGVVIGSLGVLDDVTVTQVAAVRELHRAQPDQTRRILFRSAMTIGRDHISSTVNTLFLAYAGAALPLLLLFTGIGESVTGVVTREVVAVEVVRALVGSIGLVASVPISTWLAMHVVTTSRSARLHRPGDDVALAVHPDR